MFKIENENLAVADLAGVRGFFDHFDDLLDQIILDGGFMPSCLDIRAAIPLSAFIRELEGLLAHRMTALSGRLSEAGSTRAVAELQDFLLLMVINKTLPLIRHLGTIENLHPTVAYAECVKLAGELSTFMAADKRAPEFPAYQHDDLARSFAPVIRTLRQYLSSVLETSAVSIPTTPGISAPRISMPRSSFNWITPSPKAATAASCTM